MLIISYPEKNKNPSEHLAASNFALYQDPKDLLSL